MQKYAALTTIGLALATMVCITLGIWDAVELADKSLPERISNVIYEAAQALLLNMSPRPGVGQGWLMAGRLLAVLLFTFVSYQVIRKLFSDSFEAWRLSRCRKVNHIVICGLGRIGWPLARQHLDQGDEVIILESNPNNEHIKAARAKRAIVLIGDASDVELLEQAHLATATRLYLVTGSDAENLECCLNAQKLLKNAGSTSPLSCHVHLFDPELANLLATQQQSVLQVNTFNITLNSVRDLIVEQLVKVRPRHRHEAALYVIFGFGNVGQTLARHLAELAHFENEKRPRLLILSEQPDRDAEQFLQCHGQFSPIKVFTHHKDVSFNPNLDAWGNKDEHPEAVYQVDNADAIEFACQAVFAPLPHSLSDREFLVCLERLVAEPGIKPACLFVMEEDQKNFSAALQLTEQMKLQTSVGEVPMYVWLPRQESLKALLMSSTGSIHPFGSCAEELTLDKLHEPLEEQLGIAINHAYQVHFRPKDTAEKLPTPLECWKKESERVRYSNRMAAIHAQIKFATEGLKLTKQDCRPAKEFKPTEAIRETFSRMEHNRWMAEKLMAGTSYGTKSDSPHRRPQLVTWAKLIETVNLQDEIEKDYVQVAAVLNAMPKLGLQLVSTMDEATNPGTVS